MSECPFIRNGNSKPREGGGNMLTNPNRLVVRRTAAIGDSLAATVVADRLINMGFDVHYQTHPANHCVIKRHPRIVSVGNPDGWTDVNLDGAYEHDPNRRGKHFHTMFFEVAQQQLSRYGIMLGQPLNCRPRLRIPEVDKIAARKRFEPYPRPWVFICPRSESYNVRQVPDGIWHIAAPHIKGTKFWLGRHPAPAGYIDLRCQHFDDVIRYLSIADILCTVDTGPMHVAAALGTQVVALGQSSSPEHHLGNQVDFQTIHIGLDCEDCQQNLCPKNNHVPPCQNFDPNVIASWINSKMRRLDKEEVSAVVAIYQPRVEVLNRCLDSLHDQVDEIVVTAEGRSVIPQGCRTGGKIRYVRTPAQGIGYSGNANFGARHTCSKYILFSNDDAWLKPDAVSKMREVMGPQVGIVSNLLRYPDGTIYHAGKIRGPGEMGWGHISHRQHHGLYTEPVEAENTCGCVILTRRETFFGVGGFDEMMPLFAQDDDYCLSARRQGWKIIYTPHSEGWHEEHQSVAKVGSIAEALSRDNSVFTSKWGDYLRANSNRIPGIYDY